MGIKQGYDMFLQTHIIWIFVEQGRSIDEIMNEAYEKRERKRKEKKQAGLRTNM